MTEEPTDEIHPDEYFNMLEGNVNAQPDGRQEEAKVPLDSGEQQIDGENRQQVDKGVIDV